MRASRSDDLQLDGCVAELAGWTLLEIGGSHRERFLASQVTSDVSGLAVGDSQLSALLDRTGRLQAFFYLYKLKDQLRLLVPAQIVDHLVELLEKNIIADDVTLRRCETGPMRLALGPAAVAAATTEDIPIAGWGSRGFVTWGDRELSWPKMESTELDALRVLGGPPVWDREVSAGQLVNETVLLDTAVSFDKGCYLGQETVAKVASHRGAVRGPVTLELAEAVADVVGAVGQTFAVGEKDRAGEVFAAAIREGTTWLSADLHRELRVVGREIRCVFDDGFGIDATVRPAPLLPAPTRDEMADELTTAASAAFAVDYVDRALELLDRAIAISPEWADAHEAKGVILGRLDRVDEAVECMERLLEIDTSSVMAHSNLSLFFNRLGDNDQAEHHLAMSTRLSMGAPLPESEATDAAAEADRRRREEMFRQVLEIDPEDALAHFGLGELEVERGNLTEAIEHLDHAVAADPTHAAAILALGTAHEGLGDVDFARETYERGVDIAAKKGDQASARKMQERLNALTVNGTSRPQPD